MKRFELVDGQNGGMIPLIFLCWDMRFSRLQVSIHVSWCYRLIEPKGKIKGKTECIDVALVLRLINNFIKSRYDSHINICRDIPILTVIFTNIDTLGSWLIELIDFCVNRSPVWVNCIASTAPIAENKHITLPSLDWPIQVAQPLPSYVYTASAMSISSHK